MDAAIVKGGTPDTRAEPGYEPCICKAKLENVAGMLKGGHLLASVSVRILKGVACDLDIQHGPWPLAVVRRQHGDALSIRRP